MKKAEFVKLMADRSGYTQKDVALLLDVFDEIMMEEIFAKEDSIKLGIGTFSGVTKPARMVRNPRTGEQSMSEEKHGQPKYKPSKAAKE